MHRFLLILLALQPILLSAQVPMRAIVREIVSEGNTKTRHRILTRELTFKIGDTIPLSNLATTLEGNRLRLMNTNLFNSVQMNVKNWTLDDSLTVVIKVVENWYFYPVPIFELADRNINVWWNEQNHSLKRTNYGLRLTYGNATGRRDPLSALVQFGYTPKLQLSYNLPYLNEKQTFGMFGSVFYAVNREVGYKTDSNRIIFYQNKERSIQKRFSTNLGFTYTPGLYSSHVAAFGFARNQIDTSVSERLNPTFFLNGRSEQSYFWMTYNFTNDRRDIRPYPTRGHLFSFDASKYGFLKTDDVNTLDVSARLAKYTPLSKKLNLETVVKFKTALLRQTQPYNFQRALGFGSDFVRGYELFVMDGFDFALSKNSLRFELLNKEYSFANILKWKPLQGFRSFPVKCYLTANFDGGYARSPQLRLPSNTFANRPIYGGGIGLDLVLYYSMVWSFEYSWNHLGMGGFYLRYRG